MPNIINNTSGKSFIVGSTRMEYEVGSDEAQNNATIIYNMLSQLGWSKLAVAAFFGNVQQECQFNPNLKESGGTGYGLVQWTPESNLTDVLAVVYPEGYTKSDGVQQVNALVAEYQKTNKAQGHPDSANWDVERQWYNSNGSSYGFSLSKIDWYDWAHDETESLETMVKMFMVSYLRPGYDVSENQWPKRLKFAEYWLDWIGGVDPSGSGRFFPSGCLEGGEDEVSNKEIIKAVQAILKAVGYYTGEIDGIMGTKTRTALKKVGLI